MISRMARPGVTGWVCRGAAVSAVVAVLAMFSGCGGPEAAQVRAISARGLKCTPDEVNIMRSRSLPELREWLAGCNFTVMRIYCNNEGSCYHPPPRVPCIGSKECPKDVFEEHGQPDLLWGSND